MTSTAKQYQPKEISFLRNMVKTKPVSKPEALISKWIEGRRSYPKGTPFPGPHRNRRTPYSVELMDNMSPYSPIQFQDVLKGVQLGITVSAENVIAYWIGESPTEILYVSATEGSLEKWAIKRLEPLIDSCELRSLITDTGHNPKSRRTGDKTFSKTFYGGALDMVSAQSGSKLRSDSKRVVILDEIDGAPILLRTGEGKYTKVAEGRTSAYDGRQKVYGLSTPTEYHTSEIWNRFQLGDKRQFLVPCPHCKKHQWLDHNTEENSKHGLRRETKAGILIDAYYLCEYCHEAIFNHHKGQMLAGGYWEPTCQSSDPLRRSYHLSSLYSPAGMFTWMSYWKQYQEAMDTPDGMRAFTNLYKGMPYRETGSKPILQNVIELRGEYLPGSIPKGVLFLTVGLDVQRGSEKNKENPPRLELEIVGHGLGYRTWSIDYKRFDGAVDDPSSGAWAALQSWAESGGLHYKNMDSRVFSPVSIFMDANDNFSTSAVYEFCAGWKGAVPIRGASQLKARKNEKSDSIDQNRHSNVKRFRWIKADNDINVVMISTVYYKTLLYRRLKISRKIDSSEQGIGFCDFPIGYPDAYFKGLTAEEFLQDGSFHCPSGRRNEPLDCRVYALTAADVFLDAQVKNLQSIAKKNGKKDHYIQSISSKDVLQLLESALKQNKKD